MESDNKKVQIAVCLSGEPRYLERISSSLKKIRDIHGHRINVDVFFHLWENVTKRQQFTNEDPILESVDIEKINKELTPVSGVIDSKDILDNEAESIVNHAKSLIFQFKDKKLKDTEFTKMITDVESVRHQLKFTNWPWYSQMYSLSKSQLLRTQYEKNNNIKYDIVIRTRTDVEFTIGKIEKLFNIKTRRLQDPENRGLYKIFFPQMYVKGGNRVHNRRLFDKIGSVEDYSFPPIHVEYYFFVGDSNSLNESIFLNYKQDIINYMIQVRAKDNICTLFQPTSHTYLPYLILKYNKNTELRCDLFGFKHKLLQLPKLF